MSSLETFILKIKPALDKFLRNPTKDNMGNLEKEMNKIDWVEMKIYHIQLLLPLLLKLEELNDKDQDLKTCVINGITFVTSKLYIKDVKALQTMLVIIFKQIKECDQVATKPNLPEEIKLAVVECMTQAIKRSTTDVLEQFYTNECSMLLGLILLTLVEFIERENYKKLIKASIDCLMTAFYCHDEADFSDVVLRNQVADTLFMYLPKILTVLFKKCMSDETIGETIKYTALKALARILCIIYDETNEVVIKTIYDDYDFKNLVNEALNRNGNILDDEEILGSRKSRHKFEERMNTMRSEGRTEQWFSASSRKLRVIFKELTILRSHNSTRIRYEYAQLCCTLLQRCGHHLKENFIHLLETIVGLSEDDDLDIKLLCKDVLCKLQNCQNSEFLFDESSELLFEEHLTKLPRIINRCDDDEQYSEMIFLRGFLHNLNEKRLQILFSLPKFLEMFCMCLISAVDLNITTIFLKEEYTLNEMSENEIMECNQLQWRKFKNLNTERTINVLKDICVILGQTKLINHMIYDFYIDLLQSHNNNINEIILILIWLTTNNHKEYELTESFLEKILNDKHWNLSLQADKEWRLKTDRPSDWYVENTPGLFESAIEIRKQDCDSDDEDNDILKQRITLWDVKFNTLHTCLVLDSLGHCALALGSRFDKYMFPSLHKVLYKAASSNTMIHQASYFCLNSIQKALHYTKISQLIEIHTDYITYHLNNLLKKNPENESAVNILTVVLNFSTRTALPYLDNIIQTICNECAQLNQTDNVCSYLKVFNAFLEHFTRWLSVCAKEIQNIPMQIDADIFDLNYYETWLNILEKPKCFDNIDMNNDVEINNTNIDDATNESKTNHNDLNEKKKEKLPQHVEVIKNILNQAIKFVSSSKQSHQILSLECLNKGLPLLIEYEDELLPMVHLTWQPLVEKFHQNDTIVLNRCFTLLSTLATVAREFIVKRSLNDVMPFLQQFLQFASKHSAAEPLTTKTQERKLQYKLLQELPNLIQNMKIDGKVLNDIFEIVSLYLSKKQPEDLQESAVNFYNILKTYDGPFVYLIVSKKAHLKDYKENADKILKKFQITSKI